MNRSAAANQCGKVMAYSDESCFHAVSPKSKAQEEGARWLVGVVMVKSEGDVYKRMGQRVPITFWFTPLAIYHFFECR